MFSCLIEFWCRLDVSEQRLRSEKRNNIHGGEDRIAEKSRNVSVLYACGPMQTFDRL